MQEYLEELYGSHYQGDIKIYKCYNNSFITATNNSGGIIGYSFLSNIYLANCGTKINSDIRSDINSGGMIGYNDRGIIEIYNSYSLGKVSSKNYLGGLIGYTGGNQKIENSYFAGTIEGGKNVGAISYSTGGTALNCYYINTMSNTEKEGITALSEENMKGNDTLFNSLKSYTNSEYELSEWKKDANQYPIHSDQ